MNRGSIPNVLLCWRSDAVTAKGKSRRAIACPDYISPVPAVCAEPAPVVGVHRSPASDELRCSSACAVRSNSPVRHS